MLKAELKPTPGDLTFLAHSFRQVSIANGWSISSDRVPWNQLPDDRKQNWLNKAQAFIDIINSRLNP